MNDRPAEAFETGHLNDGLVELANGATVYARVHGEGPPVVFIGGLGDDHTLFAPVVEGLSQQYRCLTFDNRGVGLSSSPNSPHTISAWADDTHLLVGELGFPPCVAVGCSMGGAIALEWCLRHPDDLQGLVLIDTWAKTDAYLAAVTSHWSELAADGASQRLAESLMLFCVSPTYLESHQDFASELLEELITNPSGFRAQADACVAHDARDRLGEIAVPTLVVSGRYDILMRSHCDELTHAIHEAKFASVDTGHVPFWERPQETLRLVGDFLADIFRT